MKSKKVIQDFLDGVRAKDELNRMAIIGYCSQMGINVEFNNSDVSLEAITLERFTQWANRSEVSMGDVITLKSSGEIGIVKKVDMSEIAFVVSIGIDGLLSLDKRKIPAEDYHLSTDAEKLKIQRLISQKGFSWDNKKGGLTEISYPNHNTLIKLTVLGKRIGYGVFREFDKDDNAVMYCVKMLGEPIRFSLKEVIGSKYDFQYQTISTYDRTQLAAELSQLGKKWNGSARRIEPTEFRVKEGDNYFFIDDCFNVRTTAEKGKNKDKMRVISGNYFKSQEDAQELLEAIIEIRNNQFLRPEPFKRKPGRPRKVKTTE